jgi:hypothetical protein
MTVTNPGSLPSSMETASQPGVTPDGTTDNTTALQAWLTGQTNGNYAHLPAAGEPYVISSPLTLTNFTGTLRIDGTVKAAAGFAGTAMLIVNGGNVTIEAPTKFTILNGNAVASNGLYCENAAQVRFRDGMVTSTVGSGVVAIGSGTNLLCYHVNSLANVSGVNSGIGFYAASGALLRTTMCEADQNDNAGFFIDRTAAPGCRIDGRAYNNAYTTGNGGFGARCRSFQGRIARLECDSNLGGGVAIEFGGDSWEIGEVLSINSGNFTNTSGYAIELFGATRCQIGRVIGQLNSGYTLAHTANTAPLATTISNGGAGITAGAMTIPGASAGNWQLGGVLLIGSELITYTGTNGNSFTGCARGAFNTTPAAYPDGTPITQNAYCRSNNTATLISDATDCWDGDPAIHFSGSSVHNHIATAIVTGHTMAVSIGEGVVPAANNYNRVGTLIADKVGTCIFRIDGGSYNRIDSIEATDCWNSSGTYPANLYFNAAAATVQNNTVGRYKHITDDAPAPTATIAEANGATGNMIDSTRQTQAGAPYLLQTMPRSTSLANMTVAPTSGSLYVVGGDGALVIPAGQPINNIHLWTGTTAAGTVSHWWYVLISQITNLILAATADSTGQAGAADTDQVLALTSTYIPDIDTPVWIGYCIVAGTMPTLFGQDWNSIPSNIKAAAPVAGGSYGGQTGLTTPLAVGTNLGNPTNFRNVPFAGLS